MNPVLSVPSRFHSVSWIDLLLKYMTWLDQDVWRTSLMHSLATS